MYKYLLCWRYLKTRYIALASVVSVMLGVATMIVVNAVMAGFAEKMRDRLHGVLADVVVESYSLNGFSNWGDVEARVKEVAGEQVESMQRLEALGSGSPEGDQARAGEIATVFGRPGHQPQGAQRVELDDHSRP